MFSMAIGAHRGLPDSGRQRLAMDALLEFLGFLAMTTSACLRNALMENGGSGICGRQYLMTAMAISASCGRLALMHQLRMDTVLIRLYGMF